MLERWFGPALSVGLGCFEIDFMPMGQNLRYLFSRDYHLFKRLLKVTTGF